MNQGMSYYLTNACPLCKVVISEIKQGLEVFKVPQIIEESKEDYDSESEEKNEICNRCLEIEIPAVMLTVTSETCHFECLT
jgi:hypothetical protein